MATGKSAATWEARGYQTQSAELQARLSGFEKSVYAAIHPFLDSVTAKPTPERIYHYTDYTGIHGILESGSLRFGDVFSLNDPSEIYHGMGVSLRLLRERVESSDSKIKRFFVDRYESFLNSGVKRSGHFHVCCFSTNSDSLSQWRAYADNGAGYALGFDAGLLESAYGHINGARAENRSVFHVTYDDKKLLELHEKIIESMFGLIEVPLSMVEDQQAGGTFLKDLSTLTSLHALHASLYFKHEAYSDESEYRFMTVEPSTKPLQGMKRRLRPHELVRYTELDWRHLAKNALVEVVIGPAAPASAETYVRECVHEYHHREVKVRRSRIPYRTPHR